MKRFYVDIVAKDEQVYSGEADYLLLPGWNGETGILPSHTSMIAMLKPGVCILRLDDNEHVWAMSEGFVSITKDKVTAAVNFAYSPDEIDVSLAKTLEEESRKSLSEKSGFNETDEDYLNLQRALTCIKVEEEYDND